MDTPTGACLLDDDAECVPPAAESALHVPERESAPPILVIEAAPRVLRLPLYRLAPRTHPRVGKSPAPENSGSP